MKSFAKILCMLLAIMLLGTSASAEGAKYVVGTNAEFPPFEYIADDGSFAGFDMELIAAILDGMGAEYEFTTIEFDALIPALSSGRMDIVIAAMTIKEDRQENALFSDPYFHATQKIIVRADNDEIKEEADLDGKMIGVQLGTTGDLYISEDPGYTPQGIERYAKAIDAVLDVLSGRLDAVIVDEGVSTYFLDAIDGLQILDETLSDEYYGIAVRLGSDELIGQINEQLQILRENGVYDEIFSRYFESIDTEEPEA